MRRADHVDADDRLVAERGDPVRPAPSKRDAVAGGELDRLVADLEARPPLQEQVGLLAGVRARPAGRRVAGLELPHRELERAVERRRQSSNRNAPSSRRPLRPAAAHDPATLPSSASSRNGDGAERLRDVRSVSSDGSSRPRSTWLSIETETPAPADSAASVRLGVTAPADRRAELAALDVAEVRSTLISASPKPMLASGAMSRRPTPSGVLVTGAAGGLGSALVAALLARGDRRRALDRAPSRSGRECARTPSTCSTTGAPPRAGRLPRRGRASGTSSRSPAARCRTRRCASIRPTCRLLRLPVVARPEPGHGVDRAGRGAAAPAGGRRRPLDHALLVHRRARRLRAPGYAAAKPGLLGLCGRWRPRSAPTASGSTRSRPATSRRRATCAVGARARLVRPAPRGVRARPARHAARHRGHVPRADRPAARDGPGVRRRRPDDRAAGAGARASQAREGREIETTIVSLPYPDPEVSSQVARDGVTDSSSGSRPTTAGRLGRGVQRRRRGLGGGRGPRDGAVRDRPRSVEPRGDAADLFSTASGSSAPAPATSPGPGSTWRSRPCGSAAGEPLYRLLGGLGAARCRTSTTWRAAATRTSRRSARAASAGLRHLLPEGRRRRRGRSRDGRGGARARCRPAAPPRRERHLGVPAGAAAARPDGRARHRLRRAAGPRPPDRPWRSARAAADAGVRERGLWSEADAYARIRARQADVYCFSPYWVGSIAAFHRLAHVAHLEGCRSASTPRRARARAGRRPPRAADAAEHRRGAPADRARDGERHPDAPLPIATAPRGPLPDGVDLDAEARRPPARPTSARWRSAAARSGCRSPSRAPSAGAPRRCSAASAARAGRRRPRGRARRACACRPAAPRGARRARAGGRRRSSRPSTG